jgi:outer membrane protein OmpA-like peptidoglycan-associated protein
MLARMVKVVALGALMVGGLSLGGCKSVNKSDYDAVLQENTELRDKLTEEQRARQEAETRNASLEQENRDLASRADAAGKNGGARTGGATGFEGSGFESYRTAGGEVVVSALGDVLFDSGKATLKSSAKKSLDKVASVIQSQYAGHMVRVEGYSDSDPIKKSGWKTNERLSGERAMAVEEYLTGRGLSRDQIYYAGFGSARPKGSKKDSRRVEIVILAGQK